MGDRKRGATTTTFAFATIFLLVAMSLCAVSFSTNHWLETFVIRDELIQMGVDPASMDEPIFYTRYRGLFRTCYPEEATFLDNHPEAVEGLCLKETTYEIPSRNPLTIPYGPNYDIRIHLMRAQFAGLVLAILFFFVANVTAVLGCWNVSPRLMRSTGSLTFIGMFFAAGAMAVFHGIIYLDDTVLTDVPWTSAYIRYRALFDVDYARLEDKTYIQMGYSYIIGWVAVGVAVIAGILFLVVGYKYHERNRDLYGRKNRLRNRPYDYMEQPYGGAYPGPAAGPDYNVHPPVQDIVYVDPYSAYRY